MSYVSTWMSDHLSSLLMSLTASQLMLVDLNPFRPWFFLSLDFHESWYSKMSTYLCTKVKQQWATLTLGWGVDHFSVLLVSLMALQLALVDQNPFWP